jgi:hypothetical protein
MKKKAMALCLVVAAQAHAAVPRTISYQGRLTNASGQPVNATESFTFKLYLTGSGGIPVWTETHGSVAVSHGLFTVSLGSLAPLGLAFDRQYHLGVSVGAGPEMTPRQPFTSAPYAFRSDETNAFVPNAVTTGVVQPGTVTPDKLATSCATGQILVRSPTGWQCGWRP